MSREEIALDLIKYVYNDVILEPEKVIKAYFDVLKNFEGIGKL